MKRTFFILTLLLLTSCKLWSFEYAGFGIGPNIDFKGERATAVIMQGEWQPHRVVGARFFLGFREGFWIGTALNLKYTVLGLGRNSNWGVNFSLPLMLNIHSNSRTAYIGFTAGNSFSLSMDDRGDNFLVISPAEFWFTPLVWRMYPSGGWDKQVSVSVLCSVGFRSRL